MNPLDFYKKLLTLTILFCGGVLFAQPANDNCSGAIELTIAADQASCVPIAGTTLGADPDDQASNPSNVCSGSWFRDDVWYKFTTGAVIPNGGIAIEVTFDNQDGAGMSSYVDGCVIEAANYPSNCGNWTFGVHFIPFIALAPNTEYILRVWSIGHATDNAADFTICAFGVDGDPLEEQECIWGDNGEGEFTGGVNDWTITNTIDGCGWEEWPNGFDDRDIDYTLNSPTSTTGTVTFNTAFLDRGADPPCPAPQSGTLTSPEIDLTGFEQDYLAVSFWQYFSQFGSSTFVEYSFDSGMTWSGRQINTEAITNGPALTGRAGFNIPFSDTQGQSSMQIRFRIEPANYYFWMIDDVKLVRGDCVDLIAPANNFYAIAPNSLTPASQAQEIAFLNDVANVGGCDLDNVVLTATVSDDNGVIYTDTKDYGTMLAGTDVQNEPFATTYMMPNAVGMYSVEYSITNGQPDDNPGNNSETFTFEISEDLFSKERGVNPTLFNVNPDLWDATERKSWGVGNHYYMPNGVGPNQKPYELTNLTIAYQGDATNAGQIYDIFLYQWDDDGDGLVQPNERTIIASTAIEVAEADGFGLLDVTLEAEDGGDNVILESDRHYLAWVQYSDNDEVLEFNFGFDEEQERGAMDLAFDTIAVRAGDSNLNRFGTMWISDENLDGEYRAFGTDAIIRMRINECDACAVVGTEDPLPQANKISIFPNPTSDRINLDLKLAQNEEYAKVNIVDVTGKVVKTYELANVQIHTATYDVSDLPAGAYLIQYIAETGTRTMKFAKHN